MTEKDAIPETDSNFPSLSPGLSKDLQSRAGFLAEGVYGQLIHKHSGLIEPLGRNQKEKIFQEIRRHVHYLAEAVLVESAAIYTEYLGWSKVFFQGMKLPEVCLEDVTQLLGNQLYLEFPREASAIIRLYLKPAVETFRALPDEPPPFIDEGMPQGETAKRYLELLLKPDRQAASRLILELAEGGVPVKDIYLHVFQPAQYEVGRLWQLNRLTVAQEHFFTASTQLIMSQLYPHIFNSAKTGRRMVAACVGAELHELGIRMVADFFEMEGWDSYYLGANSPPSAIVDAIVENRPDLVALSTTMPTHIPAVEEVIRTIREREDVQETKILAGGYPFRSNPNLWKRVRADGTATNALEAVAAAENLLARKSAE